MTKEELATAFAKTVAFGWDPKADRAEQAAILEAATLECFNRLLREASALDARPEVVDFAQAMELRLRENDWKGGWREMTCFDCLKRMRDEMCELIEALSANGREGSVQHEALDVANFAMMLRDQAKRLGMR